MIITKVTEGCVSQRFDTDTGTWLDQSFCAGDLVEYEDSSTGNPIKVVPGYMQQAYLPFEMVQPAMGELAHVNKFLQGKPSFVVITFNKRDPSQGGPFEAWAYSGPLNFETASPDTFGTGDSPTDALEALDVQISKL